MSDSTGSFTVPSKRISDRKGNGFHFMLHFGKRDDWEIRQWLEEVSTRTGQPMTEVARLAIRFAMEQSEASR